MIAGTPQKTRIPNRLLISILNVLNFLLVHAVDSVSQQINPYLRMGYRSPPWMVVSAAGCHRLLWWLITNNSLKCKAKKNCRRTLEIVLNRLIGAVQQGRILRIGPVYQISKYQLMDSSRFILSLFALRSMPEGIHHVKGLCKTACFVAWRYAIALGWRLASIDW